MMDGCFSCLSELAPDSPHSMRIFLQVTLMCFVFVFKDFASFFSSSNDI